MLTIGPHHSPSRVVVAPMAGVTDRPFRDLCRRYGANWTVSEMVTSDQSLWHTEKSRLRLGNNDETGVRWIQLAGTEPGKMAAAAQANVDLGAQIIDINMGCPAKKVCNKAAGSALLRDEELVGDILSAVVKAVNVPVTLKTRLGWSRDEMNGERIARIAEDTGIQLLTMHGRTRACRFAGKADYDAIAAVKAAVSIPVLANGDIDSTEKAVRVLKRTGCDGVMIGRGAQGRPWLPAQIDHFLLHGELKAPPAMEEQLQALADHVIALHEHYGELKGLRIARKHVGWTFEALDQTRDVVRRFNRIESASEQLKMIETLIGQPLAA